MKLNVSIRKEEESDWDSISEVTRAAFEGCAYSHQTEVFIVNALRAAHALTVSLVAEVEGRVVGHIAFSPATVSDGSPGWYGVGPLSVSPERQRQGIGQSLMREGLRLLKEAGANGCVLVGDPKYYERFGFKNSPDLILEGVPKEVFQALPFGDQMARGEVVFHPAFFATK